jgi:hypothetical protein
MWITAADLPRLRSWATPANPVWRGGIQPALKQALDIYDKEFFPGGQPNPKWPDTGIDNWVGRCTEAFAEFFAFMSLVDPDAAAREKHAERAKRLLMVVIREAAKGRDASQNPAPFRGGAFATYNRANAWGEAFGLTVDWIYPTLTAEDKALVRKAMMRWADDNIHAATTAQEHPEPIGLTDDPRVIADRKRLRWAANNYFTGHIRQLVTYGLSLDPADDPPLDPSKPEKELGNTLRSYLDNAIGAWLYMSYAMHEEPAIAAKALGVPEAGLGAASGGLSPEGFLYGASLGVLHQTLLALYTAGLRDPKKLGPQIGFIESAYWDRFTEGFLHSLVGEPQPILGQGYLGPSYQVAAYGDTLRFWFTPEHGIAFLSMAMHADRAGNAARAAKARWIALHALEGGRAGLEKRMTSIWGNSNASLAILHFLAMDPAAPAAPDPRPSLPLSFFDKSIGRLVARTDWTPNHTMFDYKCGWSTIGHQHGDCNQFELFRKGEWLVKERTGYANDLVGLTSGYHNTIAIQNKVASGAAKPKGLQWFEEATWEHGGQFLLGTNYGDPTVVTSIAPKWVYAFGDATTLYNRTGAHDGDEANDVAHASRSIAWIQPDDVIVYDRATSRSEGRFKRFFLVTVGTPEVSGKLATVTTAKGQKLFVETLLPATARVSFAEAEAYNMLAQGEPSRYRIKVEDPANPKDMRFLHVLHAADAGGAQASVTAIQSSAGTAYAGAAVGSVAAVFPVDPAAPFTRVTYAVPAAVTGQLVTGLVPGASYEVTTRAAGATVEVTVAPGSGVKADEGGVIALGSLKRP